jgi:hypothetical protein
MACKHERIKSENCVISCIECGEILPIDYLVAKDRIKAQKEAEQKAEPVKEEAPKKAGRKKVK